MGKKGMPQRSRRVSNFSGVTSDDLEKLETGLRAQLTFMDTSPLNRDYPDHLAEKKQAYRDLKDQIHAERARRK